MFGKNVCINKKLAKIKFRRIKNKFCEGKMFEILNIINSPEDLKKLNLEELKKLSVEVREALFNRLTKFGGHFGSNFGIVEVEIAMHYIFNSPVDKFIFDVSHQSYTHKMLTGRRSGYIVDECFKEDSGYTNPDESEHDLFNIGHTSTSLSLGSGLAKIRDLKGGKENILALIGDGSLSGGEALEALNYIGGELNSNFIIIVNDNDMSIAEVHGGLYKNLKNLRDTDGKFENNFFTSLGLDYIYEKNGNDLESLISLFKKVKNIDHPIVLHINTQKGKGYKLAEENKEAWHWCLPFDRETGKYKISFPEESYISITSNYIMEKAKKDKDFLVITPSMPNVAGLDKNIREILGDQYVDVCIAEEHAVAMASGASKGGGKPLLITASTFIQRTYDQVSQDLCINNNPATILLNFASFDSLTDVTHLGIFTLSAFSNIPNLVIMAPTSREEYLSILDWAIDQKNYPVMILMPGGNLISRKNTNFNFSGINKYKVEKKGKDIAILALGDFYSIGEELEKLIKKDLNISATLINPIFANGLDEELLLDLKKNHKIVITLEDGVLKGGLGENIAAFYGTSDIKVKSYGFDKKFYDRYNPNELLESLGITPNKILNFIKEIL